MNRRDFFKTVGIPALALPFISRLDLFSRKINATTFPPHYKSFWIYFDKFPSKRTELFRIDNDISIYYDNQGIITATLNGRPFGKSQKLLKHKWHKLNVFIDEKHVPKVSLFAYDGYDGTWYLDTA